MTFPKHNFRLTVAIFLFLLCTEVRAKEKIEDSAEKTERAAESKVHKKGESANKSEYLADFRSPKKNFEQSTDGAAFLFADELKQTLEKYLFGMCPQTFKMQLGRSKNGTSAPSCDLDIDQQELAGKFATLALRAHSAARADCARFGAALANTLGEVARTAANRRAVINAAANEANKKRKLSKSQKAKIQAKQRTALAVKKKAAAVAAAAAAKSS